MTRKRIGSSVTEDETATLAGGTTAVSEGAPRGTRERILDATDHLLARYGYRKMTIDDIAHEAGIGKGTVYLSFPSKEEVALGCIDRMVGALLVRLEAIAAESRPADERLRDMLVARVLHRFDYAQSHAASIDALLASVRPALLARRSIHFASEIRVLEALLQRAAEEGTLQSSRPAEDAQALVTATNALLPYSLSPSELGDRASVERRTAALSDLLVRGLARARSG